MRNYGDEEDEEQRLICKVIEYIHPSMAKELLVKFPDNSAYDFDYTQSSIWSPLVPRPYISSKNPKPVTLDMSLEITPSPRMKKGSCLFGLMGKQSVGKNVKKKVKNPVPVSGFDIFKKSTKMIKHHSKEFDFAASTSSSTKGWNKVLKAASKHFKKKKKKDPMAHIKLSKCLKDGNNDTLDL